MALTDPPDTLAYHASRVLTTHRDMSHVHMAEVSKRIQHFMTSDNNPGTQPEAEALWFYGLNHHMALLSAEMHPLEPLKGGDLEIARNYHNIIGSKAVRAFVYLMLICTREARHCKSPSSVSSWAKAQGWPEAGAFYKGGSSESEVHKLLLNSPPACTVGSWVKTLQWGYYNSSWAGGYGGKKWGAVTDCLVRFVTGEFTAEMMMDTVWTLAHNGGPIFNKGHCYAHHTGQLTKLLDVQRSGQIPEAVINGELSNVPSALRKMMIASRERFPGKIGNSVDWHKVEALGSVGKYPHEKNAQKPNTVDPAEQAALIAAEAAKAAAKKEAAEKAKAEAEEKLKNQYVVMHGLSVQKIKLDRAAA